MSVTTRKLDANRYTVTVTVDVPQLQCSVCDVPITDLAFLQRVKSSFVIDAPFLPEERAEIIAAQSLRNSKKIFPSRVANNQYMCSGCLEKAIINSKLVKGNPEPVIQCPFNSKRMFVETNRCLQFLSEENREDFLDKIYDFKIDIDYFRYYCPCKDQNKPCSYYELVHKIDGETLVIRCKRHGNRCILCFEEVNELHKSECCGYPKSVLTKSCVEYARCSNCKAIVTRLDGCYELTCTCGRKIHQLHEAIKPTNEKIVPLKAKRLEKIVVKKAPETISFVDDEESDVGTDFWLMQKRNHPRFVY